MCRTTRTERLTRQLAFRVVRAVTLLSAGVISCLSPTLPLPPPEAPDRISPATEAGQWIVGGASIAGAEVIVVNDVTGEGAVFVDRDRKGRYSVEISGELCDLVTVRQALGSESSAETRFVLEETVDGAPVDPAGCAP